ncbi:MAG: outer membrane protein assembly factor BamA [Myxococcota bacterium]
MESIRIRHVHQSPPMDSADDAETMRCPTITRRRLERLIEVDYGDVYTSKLRRQVRDRLRGAFQDAGFVRPRFVGLDEAQDPTRLDITVETSRCWIVRVWEREIAVGDSQSEPAFRFQDPVDQATRDAPPNAAFRRVPLELWSEVLPFGESGVFERSEASRGVSTIQERLRERGYSFADVTMTHRDTSVNAVRRGGEDAGDVRGVIDYMITKNHVRRVHGIQLPGAASFPADTLEELLATKVYDFFGASGFFDDARFFADLATLEQFYLARGFYDFQFAVRDDDAAGARKREEVQPDPADGREAEKGRRWKYTEGPRGFHLDKRTGALQLYLTAPVTEGPRTTIVRFETTGATQLTPEAITALTQLGPGRPFGTHHLDEGLVALTAWYRNRGFHHAKVQPFCEAYDSKSGDGGFCNPRGVVRADRVDLGLKIIEGPQVFVGELFWRGNFETDPHALIRDLPAPGEPLDQRKLDEAVRKMRDLGLFNSVRIDSVGLDESPPRDRAALVIAVEETNYRFMDVAFGLRSIQRTDLERVPRQVASVSGNLVGGIDRFSTGFGRSFPLDIPDVLIVLELEYLDLNVFGLGHQLRLPIKAGFSFSQFLRLASFNPTYVWPRAFDTELRLEAKVIAELDRVTDPLDRLELGAEFDLTVPLGDRMNLGFTVRPSAIKLGQPTEACLFCLQGAGLGFGAGVVDKTAAAVGDEVACDADGAFSGACSDDGFEPQVRFSTRWRFEQRDNPLHPTKGYQLQASSTFIFGKQGIDTNSIEDAFFLKWEASGQVAFDLKILILAMSFRYGGSFSFGDVSFLPSNERYTLGGSNGMRGFSDNGLCRYNADGELDPTCPSEFGGNVVVNGNVEFRVPIFRGAGVWGAAFVDVGALSKSHAALTTGSIRASWGLGLRWLLAGQWPIRLDLGFPFERRCTAFVDDGPCLLEEPNVIHIDVLYPF